ncbi:MAG TPA: hypothetical protein VGG60_08155 [Candidatus Binataceae bacterium]
MGRIGTVVLANNSVIEPEFWSVLPTGVDMHATHILASGDLTPKQLFAWNSTATAPASVPPRNVDVIAYCDMVTSFIIPPGWNEGKIAQVEGCASIPMHPAWTAPRGVLAARGVPRIVLEAPTRPPSMHSPRPSSPAGATISSAIRRAISSRGTKRFRFPGIAWQFS